MSNAEPSIPQANEPTQIHPATASASLPSLPTKAKNPEYSLRFSNRNMGEEKRFLNSIKKNQIETALKKLPSEHVQSVKNIILDYDPLAHRGLGGSELIILRAVDMGTEEMLAVLIHELGHNVDSGYLTPKEEKVKSAFEDWGVPLYETDSSLDFYSISWTSDEKRKQTAINTDFVSGYAMSDCFEDFAESYAYYVLHNKDFKRLAASSEALYAKYHFMKYEVFGGAEFDTADGIVKEKQRPWDVTVLHYDFSEFLS